MPPKSDAERRTEAAKEVKLTCMQDYYVRDEKHAAKVAAKKPDYKKGQSYSVPAASVPHMVRQTYAVHDKDGRYQGDAPVFVDPKAAAEMQEAEDELAKAAKAAAEKTAKE